mmetsp:Transcript_52701/g.155305  ORF Transcript_52701/g.155305 Transcript_52701/m.155305 type:complete len:230 (+) Transcript_52701:543-1232(+)
MSPSSLYFVMLAMAFVTRRTVGRSSGSTPTKSMRRWSIGSLEPAMETSSRRAKAGASFRTSFSAAMLFSSLSRKRNRIGRPSLNSSGAFSPLKFETIGCLCALTKASISSELCTLPWNVAIFSSWGKNILREGSVPWYFDATAGAVLKPNITSSIARAAVSKGPRGVASSKRPTTASLFSASKASAAAGSASCTAGGPTFFITHVTMLPSTRPPVYSWSRPSMNRRMVG